MEVIIGLMVIGIVLFLTSVVQRNNRYSKVRYVYGVDMCGVNEFKSLKEKVQWIRKQPNYNPKYDPVHMLDVWERKATLLDDSGS